MIRMTTNGVLKGYKSNLMSSFVNLAKKQNTVLTQRNFNSYAEDPAAASQAFQLRRNFLRTNSQYTVSDHVMRKFQIAYTAVDSVVGMVDNDSTDSALYKVMRALNTPTASGRNALGDELIQLSESIVETLNCQYGDSYVFAGSDGLNVPFEWDGDTLLYRGIDVNTTDPDELAKLKEISEEEGAYVDIGLGLQEDNQGVLIKSSAYNSSLQGINFLGYGEDEEGLPNNAAVLIREMGIILSNCVDGGDLPKETAAELNQLFDKLHEVSDNLHRQHAELTTEAEFLENNHALLETTAYTLNEQILGLEQVNAADAITAFSWAQYSYNAALKVGNSVLSQSLMDYLN